MWLLREGPGLARRSARVALGLGRLLVDEMKTFGDYWVSTKNNMN